MTAATSTLSSSARRALRAAAHHLDPVVMVGQHGLTPAVLHEIDLALTAHALIKVRVMSDEREVRVGFLNEICEKMGCESVQHLGKLLVLWRNAEGEAAADDDAEHDAAAVKASKSGRGPRTKLPAEWANVDTPQGARSSAPQGERSRSALPPGERRRYGEIPPAPRREGWAPKDRRGAARAGGEEAPGTRRREEKDGFAATAPRGRAPYGDGASRGGSGAGGGRGSYGGGDSGGRAPAGGPPRSRSGYGGNTPAGGSGYGGGGGSGSGFGGGGGGYNRGGAGDGGQGGGYGRGNEGGGGAPRARWGDRRDSSDGRSGGGSGGGYGGGNSGGGYGDRSVGGGGFSGDRRPAPAGGGFSARGGSGNRDGVTGKPSGFSRGGTGAGGGAPAPRTRRRMG